MAAQISKSKPQNQRFKPKAFTYAALRIDPAASVTHLDDPIATAAAEAMSTKVYLVYIRFDLALPFPGAPWYAFTILPVATSLRAAKEDEGITAEMCIPIFPNEVHPTGRTPLRTETPFPFSNCYHWAFTPLSVRARSRPQGWLLSDGAIRMLPRSRVEIECRFSEDDNTVRLYHLANRDSAKPMDDHNIQRGIDPENTSSALDRSSGAQEFEATSEPDIATSDADYTDITHIFDLANPAGAEFMPIVDMWYDFSEHLKEEDIPSPLELINERDQIIRIIKEARARNPALPVVEVRTTAEALKALDKQMAGNVTPVSHRVQLEDTHSQLYLFGNIPYRLWLYAKTWLGLA